MTNPDQEESCAVAQVRAKTGDSLVFAEYKDIWLTTNTQPESCNGLGRLMLSSPLMTTQDRQQRLWGQLRAGQSGLAIATAQTIGLDLSLAQLNQIQANPLAYLWTAPKANDADYAYLIFALGRVADSDFTNALGNLQKVAQDTPQSVQKYLYRTIGYVGGTTVMKNGFNREVLNAYEAKKIVTACPHCFNTLKNEYPELGGKYEVIHHTEFLKSLLDEGRLTIEGGQFKGKKITFHDPCYLGRANKIYEAPRDLIQKLDVELVEMKRSKANGLCCGAGGAQMFKDAEAGAKEINIERTEDALEVQPDIIAAGCPFCNTMLTDGIKNKEKESEVKVLDIAELIANAQDL